MFSGDDKMIKPYLLGMLKELALLGAMNNFVEISSLEVAQRVQSSQQTASRYLLELDKMNMIKREIGVKKQLIQITTEGSEVLKEEYIQYQHIFELPKKIHFKGRIISGIGEGTYYTSQEGYIEQFKKKIGYIPYPGTLNIEIEHIDKNKLRLIKKFKSVDICSFETKNRTFGEVKCLPAFVNGVQCVLVLPARGHYSTVLEFIASVYLRDELQLHDGDIVEVEIDITIKGSTHEQ